MPPFYISNTSQALQNMQDYAMVTRHQYIEELLEGTNPIIWKTFEAASNFVEHTKVGGDCTWALPGD